MNDSIQPDQECGGPETSQATDDRKADGARRLPSRGAAARVLVALLVAVTFLAVARQIEPDEGLAVDQPAPGVDALSTPRGELGTESDASASAEELLPPLGRLEGAQFDIEILGAGEETRYNVYHKSGALLLRNATLEQVERRFPDIQLRKLQAAQQIMMVDDVGSPY